MRPVAGQSHEPDPDVISQHQWQQLELQIHDFNSLRTGHAHGHECVSGMRHQDQRSCAVYALTSCSPELELSLIEHRLSVILMADAG